MYKQFSMSTGVSELYTSAVPEAGESHARAIKYFMEQNNVGVMGLTEAHSTSFQNALTNVFGDKCVSQSNQNKKCALVSVRDVWDKIDEQCIKFNRLMDGARTFFELNDAVAGKLVGSDVVYIVAYGSSGLSKAEDMAFLRAIQMACMNIGWMSSSTETTKIVLMGDWNTTSNQARDAVKTNLHPYFHLPKKFLKTTYKERTWAQGQIHKAHKKDHQTKDFVFVSSGLTLVSVTASDRYYINAGDREFVKTGENLRMLPSPGTHFSDHVAVVTSWMDESGTRHNTGTLNVMSDAYNAFEFHDSNPGSLSAIVDKVLDENQRIERSTWNNWIDVLQRAVDNWQQGQGPNFNVVAELEKRRCVAPDESFAIWNVHMQEKRDYFPRHEEFKKNGKILSKIYSMGNGNYRPDITSFNYADDAEIGLQTFQDCVDAVDNTDEVTVWVTAMLDAINDYTKDGSNPWQTETNPGLYIHPDNDYRFTFAQHAAVCLLMGMWMIDCIHKLKHGAATNAHLGQAVHERFCLRLRLE